MESPVRNPSDAIPGEGPEAVSVPPRPPEYEFTDADNAVFSALAGKMSFVGLFALATGIFAVLLGALLAHVGTILSGALYAVIGIWTHRAGVSFRSIAATRGRDITHLMQGLRDLKKLYTVQFWICALMLAGVLISLGALIHHTRFR